MISGEDSGATGKRTKAVRYQQFGNTPGSAIQQNLAWMWMSDCILFVEHYLMLDGHPRRFTGPPRVKGQALKR